MSKEGFPKGYGWEIYKQNEWTQWAEAHGIDLPRQCVSVVTPKREKRSFSTARKMKSSRHLHSPWDDWNDMRNGRWNFLPIGEYQEKFDGKFPEWSRTFAERGITAYDHTDNLGWVEMRIPNLPEGGFHRFWSMERERLTSRYDKRKMVVERLMESSGGCTRVTLLYLPCLGRPARIRQEDLVTGDGWRVTLERDLEQQDRLDGITHVKYIKKPRPWGEYLGSNVAQC